MNLRRYLRKIDCQKIKLEQLHYRNPGSEITETNNEGRYLQIELENEYGVQASAWFCVENVLNSASFHMEGIPWSEIPLDYIVRWLNEYHFEFYVNDTNWVVKTFTTPYTPLPSKVLTLDSKPWKIQCIDWPECKASVPAIYASDIPFQMSFVLGYSQTSVTQLIDIDIGDLLLIKNLSPRLSVGDRQLYKLNYFPNKEVIVEEMLEDSDQQHYENEILDDWASLPVNIEFVLDGQTVTLNELEQITPGMSFPLNQQSEKKIKVYLNKKLFARGELVALENGTLAVEINQIHPIQPTIKAKSYVE